MIASGLEIGPFKLEGFVSQGGAGQVWRGVHVEEDIPVAVKFVSGELTEDQRNLVRSEVRAQARLNHPGIVRFFDFGELENPTESGALHTTPYMVMEFADAGTLYERADEIDWDEIRAMLLQVLDALSFAHARALIHRDIKPENVLVFEDRDDTRFKLADFGLAHAVDRHGTTEPGKVIAAVGGTPNYMSPEQLHGSWREFGPWTDLYQVGAMAWELVTGSAPFERNSPSATALAHVTEPLPEFEARIDVPDGLHHWLRKLLEKKPRDRYQHASDAAWALMWMGQGALGGEPRNPLEAGPRPWPTDWRTGTRSHSSVSLAGAGLAIFDLRESPIVGRQRERSILWEELRRVRSTATARVISIEGAEGTGKSTLARWLGRRADEVGAAIPMRARHSPNQTSGLGLAEMFETFFRTWGMNRSEMSDFIADRLAHFGHEPTSIEDDSRALAEFVRGTIPLPDANQDATRPIWSFGSVYERFVLLDRICRTIAQTRPLVIGLDALQHDTYTLAWLRHVVSGDPFPICFIATSTTSGDDLSQTQKGIRDLAIKTTVIELEPLEPADHEEIVSRLLPLHPDVVRYVTNRTGGNPAFARQLIGDWVNRRMLVSTPEGFRLAGSGAPVPVEKSELWRRRLSDVLDEAGEATRESWYEALEIAAALGEEVDTREWTAACNLGRVVAAQALVQELIRNGLALPTRAGWRFANGQLVKALRARAIERGEWANENSLVYNAVRSLYTAHERRVSRRLAGFLEEAGELEEAIAELEEAWQSAYDSKFAFESDELLERIVGLLDRVGAPGNDPRRLRVEVRRAKSMYSQQVSSADALRIVESIEDDVRASGDLELLVDLLRGKALYSNSVRGTDSAIPIIEESVERGKILHQSGGGARKLAMSLHIYGWILREMRRFEESKAAYKQVFELDLPPWDDMPRLYAEIGLAWVALQTRDFERARSLGEAIVRNGHHYGRLENMINGYCILGEIAKFEGRWDDAVEAFEQMRLVSQNSESSYSVLASQFNLGMALLGARKIDEAHACFDMSVDTLEQNGTTEFIDILLLGKMGVAAGFGDWATWDRLFRRFSDRRDEPVDERSETGWLIGVVAALATDIGASERATDLLHFYRVTD